MAKVAKDLWLAEKATHGANAKDLYGWTNDDRWETGTATATALVVTGTLDAPTLVADSSVSLVTLSITGTFDATITANEVNATSALSVLVVSRAFPTVVPFTPDGSRILTAVAVTATWDPTTTVNNVNATAVGTALVVSSTLPAAIPAESFTGFAPDFPVTATFPAVFAEADNSVLARAEMVLLAKNYSGSGNWLDATPNGHDAVNTGATFKSHDGINDYVFFPGSSANDNVQVTLSISTIYDYTVTYEDDSTDTGTETSDGGGILTFAASDVEFGGLDVRLIDVYPDGGGDTLALFDANLVTEPAPYAFPDNYSDQTFVDLLANTWTLNRNESTTSVGFVLTHVDEPMWMFTESGGGDYFSVPTDAGLGFANQDGWTLLAKVRENGNDYSKTRHAVQLTGSSSGSVWMATRNNPGGGADHVWTTKYRYDDVSDLYQELNVDFASIPQVSTVLALRIDPAGDGTVSQYVDGVVGATAPPELYNYGAVSIFNQAGEADVTPSMHIGDDEIGFGPNDAGWDGEIYGVVLWRTALTPTELTDVLFELGWQWEAPVTTLAIDVALPNVGGQGTNPQLTALSVTGTFPYADHTPDKVAVATVFSVDHGFPTVGTRGSKENYIVFQPYDNEYLEVTYDSSFDPTGDYYEIVLRTGQEDWTPNSTAGRVYLVDEIGAVSLIIEDLSGTSGTLILEWWDGSLQSATSTIAIPSSYGARDWGWVKASIQVTGGGTDADIKFYMGGEQLAEPGSWTQLGTTVTHGSATSLTTNGSPNPAINAPVGGNKDTSVGVAWYQYIRVTNDATVVLDIDLTDLTQAELAAQSFLCKAGRTVSIYDTGAGASWAYCQVLMSGELSSATFAFMAADGNDHDAAWHNYLGTRTRNLGICFQPVGSPTWNGDSYTLDGSTQYFRIVDDTDRFYVDLYQSTSMTALVVVDMDDATPTASEVLWGVRDGLANDTDVGWAMYVNTDGDVIGEFDNVDPVPTPPGTGGFLPPATVNHEIAEYTLGAAVGPQGYAVERDWYGVGADDIEVFVNGTGGGASAEGLNWHMNDSGAGHYIGGVGTTSTVTNHLAGKVIGWAMWRGDYQDLSTTQLNNAKDELMQIPVANASATTLACTATFDVPTTTISPQSQTSLPGVRMWTGTFPAVQVNTDTTVVTTSLSVTATIPQVTPSDGGTIFAYVTTHAVTSTFPIAVPTDIGSPKFAPLTSLNITGAFDAVSSTGGTDANTALVALLATLTIDAAITKVVVYLSGSGVASGEGFSLLSKTVNVRPTIDVGLTVDVTTNVEDRPRISTLSSNLNRKRQLPNTRLVRVR